MNYQITYCGRQGSAEKTADFLFEKLPKDTLVIDAFEDTGVFAKTLVAVFEMGSNFDAIPYSIIDTVEKASGRELILLAVIPVRANETIRSRIERAILPFMPDDCEYLGLHLVRGEADGKLVRGIENVLEADPDNFGAAAWLEECEKSKGRPNDKDLEKVWNFFEKCIAEDIY